MPKLTRRDFILASAGLAVSAPASEAHKLVKPPRLRKGQKIRLIAPAGAVSDPLSVPKAKQTLENLGFQVELGKTLTLRKGYLAGSDEQRITELHESFLDPSVACVLPIRGGYGATRILDRLDYSLIRAHPKVFIGYSDITALLLAITHKAGLVTFHGPVGDSTFNDFSVANFTAALAKTDPIGVCPTLATSSSRLPQPTPETLFPGIANGPLIGGNFSVLMAVIGTKYMPSLGGAILFLEDINEDPYKVDRMFSTLALGGYLKQVKGIACGDFKMPPPKPDDDLDPTHSMTTRDVLTDYCQRFKIPSFTGLLTGHIVDKLTLPLGVRTRLDATKKELCILESSVS